MDYGGRGGIMAGEQKFVRVFGRPEIYLTACAVTKNRDTGFLLEIGKDKLADYFAEPNQFWKRDHNHDMALMKVYKHNPSEDLICLNEKTQFLNIPMPFLGHDSSDGWGELQFLIKSPATVKLARHRSFDSRINQWVAETQPIQPKTDLGTHSYLSLRFYHQGYLPSIPGDWHFEPVYVSVGNSTFHIITVWWDWSSLTNERKEDAITIWMELLDKDSPEIPKHLK